MSRCIKFRAWDIKEKKYFDCNRLNFEFDSVNEIFERDYLIFEQFTGFKDSEGKEIYEGDIVSGHTEYEESRDENDFEKEPVVVRWCDNTGFYPMTLAHNWRCDVVNLKVVGNIHETKGDGHEKG